MSTLKETGEAEFEAEVAHGVTLVDFFAPWCGPCHMQTPILEKLAEEMQGKAKFIKIDIDNNQQVTTQFGVTSVPTLVLFKDGKEVDRVVGLRDADALKSMVQAQV